MPQCDFRLARSGDSPRLILGTFSSLARCNTIANKVRFVAYREKTSAKAIRFDTCGKTEQKRSFFSGADGGTRTRDLLITNQLLYQLSHISILNVWLYIKFNQTLLFNLIISFE